MKKTYAWLFSEGMERDEKIDEINKTVHMLDREKRRFAPERRSAKVEATVARQIRRHSMCLMRGAHPEHPSENTHVPDLCSGGPPAVFRPDKTLAERPITQQHVSPRSVPITLPLSNGRDGSGIAGIAEIESTNLGSQVCI